MILIAGDIHANYINFFDGINRLHQEITACLQVGDLGGEDKIYPDFPIPTYFIQGNHENWGLLYDDHLATAELPENLHQIYNGDIAPRHEVEDLVVLGFGGNYSSRFFEKTRPEVQGGRRRHFFQEELERALCTARDLGPVDILLTHEAPSPYMNRGRNCGIGIINQLIREVKPKLHFFGHHHYYGEYEYEGVKSYGLNMGFRSAALLDPKTLEVKVVSM
jgi:Icc-related predicted phosphoesterase